MDLQPDGRNSIQHGPDFKNRQESQGDYFITERPAGEEGRNEGTKCPVSVFTLETSLGGANQLIAISRNTVITTSSPPEHPKAEMKELDCQTLSTGDIVSKQIFQEEPREEQDKDSKKTLTSCGFGKGKGRRIWYNRVFTRAE